MMNNNSNHGGGEVELKTVFPVMNDAARLYRQIDGTTIPEAIQFALAQRNSGSINNNTPRTSSSRLFDAIDTIMGGGSGNFHMNEISALNARPNPVTINPDTASAWNVLDIIRETCLIHRRQFLPLEVCMILGIMTYHRKKGFQHISEEDTRFWFNLVNIALGGSEQQQHDDNNASFAAIRQEVMRVYFSNNQDHDDDGDDNDDDDDDDDTSSGGGYTAGAA